MLRTIFRQFLLSVSLVLITGVSTYAAGLLVADGGMGGLLEIEEQSVDVTINNGIAVTTIDQIFLNTENRIVEALYMFPVPHGASVANFSMWINGKEMIGEVVEKERAREIYESYKRRNIDPGLLEQVDFKTFEMRIFPIPAGGQQRIRLQYYQQLDFDHDQATYVYPLATDSRRDIDQRTSGRFALTMRVLSEVPIQSMSSPSHKDDFVIAKRTPKLYEASLETGSGDLSRDVVLTYQTERPQTGVDLVSSNPPGEDGYFMLTVTAGEELEQLDEPMDYVFILDISGSMGNDGKLMLSRQSLGAFIEELGEADRFELMTFNVQPQTLFGELVAAEKPQITSASDFLASQKARGGTELRHAIRTAYKYGDPDRRLNVVILSDGMTEQGSRSELLRLINEKPANATVFTIGVGNEVNRPLLSQLAEDAGGLAAFISRGDDFQQKANAFRRKLTRPVASEVALDFSGTDVYDVVPAKLPNLYHGSPIRVFGRYRNGDKFNIDLTADVRGKPLKQSVELENQNRDNPEVERMWASRRIEQLLKNADRRGVRDRVKDEIVALGETFSVATEYTSFIVLENDGEYRRWKIDRRNRGRMKRDDARQAQLRKQLELMRESSLAGLGPNAPKQQVAQSPKPQKFKSLNGPTSVPSTPEPSSQLLTIFAAAWLISLVRRRRSRR